MADFAEMGIVLPMYVATLQLPMWLVRSWFRAGLSNHRLVKNQGTASNQAVLQFSLRDLLIALVLFALTFGSYRQLWSWASAHEAPFRYSSDWLAIWWRTAGIALAIVPPTIAWLSLRCFNCILGWIFTVLYTILMMVIGTAIYLWFQNTGLGGGTQEIIFAMTAGFAVPLVCGLNLLRLYGWRLEQPAARSQINQ
jgi:hypothetical protein